jgi:hypothetical protein
MTARVIRPTYQQQAVVDACRSGANLVIEAGAGTGKTSTLQMAADAMPGRTGLYLAYNRDTAVSARSAFPAGVRCVTAHALAYRAVGWQYERRLSRQASRVPAWAMANLLDIGEPLLLGKDLILTPAHLARITMGTIERFCYSADDRLSAVHVPPVNGIDAASFADLTWQIVPYAERAWYDLGRPDGRVPFKHDHYLKMWQLTRPRIGTDFIMFDEAQDANPVIAAIVQSQHDVQLIAVGDSCQAIYGWRGAVDALRDWPAERRLQLSQSFRFGQAVAAEANRWLVCLDAPFRLAGAPSIASSVGEVSDPHAILCRTNAEALLQARAALDTGRRVALAGGGGDMRLLAIAALDLQSAGQTSNPELAAFQSWDAVRAFVRTDTAGADLAASVRLIDSQGPAMVLRTVEQLSSLNRAEVMVSTAHRAKGLEWGRVVVAPDFRARKTANVPRADAMLAYVAVTRAREQLDTSGLPDVPGLTARPTATKKGETAMHTTGEAAVAAAAEDATGAAPAFAVTAADASAENGHDGPRPYLGGRAQAESGSRIIANDFDAWKVKSGSLPADHSRVEQLTRAWRSVKGHDLGDDPGAAAIRYQILAHAARALEAVPAVAGCAAEAAALSRLADHASKHAERLRATAVQLFLRSGKAGAYHDRGHAASGSRIVERDFRAWTQLPVAAQAASDSELWERVRLLHSAWDDVHRYGLTDGPGPAAVRYRALADSAFAVADGFTVNLPSAALTGLLELAGHARKHAVRLEATSMAMRRAVDYVELPEQVAAVAARARTGNGRPLASRDGKGVRRGDERDVTVVSAGRSAGRDRDA